MKNICLIHNRSLLKILSIIFCCVYCISASAQQVKNIEDQDYKNDVLGKVTNLIATKYVLPEQAIKYAAEFKKKCDLGAYDTLTSAKSFTKQVTSDLIAISHDKHINFRVIESSGIGEEPENSLHHSLRYHHLGVIENKGFKKLEWIDGNIGYLDIRRFYYIADIRDRVAAAIKFLSNADAIIIDLRENGGGSGDYLSSYFLPYPTQLCSWYSREEDFSYEFWTEKLTGIKPLTEVPLFLLTSDRTFSSAESFAYEMKVNKRAILIGDSTGGGAHSTDMYQIDAQFEIYIPTARAVNPITESNWEGTGVIPDVLVPAESALDTAIVMAKIAGKIFADNRDTKLKVSVELMQAHMNHTEMLFRENKHEEAVQSLDSVFQVAYKLEILNEFFIDVLAYNFFNPDDEQILYAILKKKIEYYPNSPTAFESLAFAYFKNNKFDLATKYYQKAIKLDPENRNVMQMIRRIQDKE